MKNTPLNSPLFWAVAGVVVAILALLPAYDGYFGKAPAPATATSEVPAPPSGLPQHQDAPLPRDLLSKVVLGTSYAAMSKSLGEPASGSPSKAVALWIFDAFALRVMFDNDELVFYSVSPFNIELKPHLPWTALQLGEVTYGRLDEDFGSSRVIEAAMYSKGCRYTEIYEGTQATTRGNDLYVGVSSSAANYPDSGCFHEEKGGKVIVNSQTRVRSRPNTFGLGRPGYEKRVTELGLLDVMTSEVAGVQPQN